MVWSTFKTCVCLCVCVELYNLLYQKKNDDEEGSSLSIACERQTFLPRSSPLRDVSRGGKSATQRQKFHTDDANCFSYCLRMIDKRQKGTKVNCKRDDSLPKQPIFVEYSLL